MGNFRSYDGTPRFAVNTIRAACGDADPEAITALSDGIRVALRDRTGNAPVVVGGNISDSEAANFTYRMFKACSAKGQPPPTELVELLQIILAQNLPPRGTARAISKELKAASDYQRDHPSANAADIGRAVKRNRSTITRWMKAGKLHRPMLQEL